MSQRLSTTASGSFKARTISTANFRSLSPNGVGSVTSNTKSLPRTPSIAGQEVPGGQSRIVRSASMDAALTARIAGGLIASPTFNRPSIN